MIVTAISMYRGYDAEMFVYVVIGRLTKDEKDKWRKQHKCDEYHCDEKDGCDDCNNMFFSVQEALSDHEPCRIVNVETPYKLRRKNVEA